MKLLADVYPFQVKRPLAFEAVGCEKAVQTWCSVPLSSTLSPISLETSTKSFAMSGKCPTFQTDWNWMDIHQPHGSLPSSEYRCATWGTRKPDNPDDWVSLTVCSDQLMAERYVWCLHDLRLEANEVIITHLSSHWVEALRHLYVFGINNARLLARDALKKVHHLVSATYPGLGTIIILKSNAVQFAL